jgi:uncharacterized protein
MTNAVTTIVRRKVRPGQEAAYEAWLERLTEGAQQHFAGYLGAEFHRPAGGGDEYRSIFRFDTIESLVAFEMSPYHEAMMQEGAALFASDAVRHRLTGLEVWFDAPPGVPAPQPSRHRMALVLFAVVFSLVVLLNAGLQPITSTWPSPIRYMLLVALQVILMTYVIMPRLTPIIAGFVYPTSKATKGSPS